MGTLYSRALCRRNPAWKKSLSIPSKRARTAIVLQERLRALWRDLEREAPLQYATWSLDRLYAEWFERAAEFLLKKAAPDLWRELRSMEADAAREDRKASKLVEPMLF